MIDLSLLFLGVIIHNQLPILRAKLLQTRMQTLLHVFGVIFIALGCCWLTQFRLFQRDLSLSPLQIFFDQVVRYSAKIKSRIAYISWPYFEYLLPNAIKNFISQSFGIATASKGKCLREIVTKLNIHSRSYLTIR